MSELPDEPSRSGAATTDETEAAPSGEITRLTEIKDRRLQLMFACCHPVIPRETQTALALKTLCGFSPAEIAKAFLRDCEDQSRRLASCMSG